MRTDACSTGEAIWTLLSPDQVSFGISADRYVAVMLDYAEQADGTISGRHLAIELTAAEARSFADILLRKANEAESLLRTEKTH